MLFLLFFTNLCFNNQWTSWYTWTSREILIMINYFLVKRLYWKS